MTRTSLACFILCLLVGMAPASPLWAQLSRSSDYVRLDDGQRLEGAVDIVRWQGRLAVQIDKQTTYGLPEVRSFITNDIFFATHSDARVHRGVATVDTKLLRRVAKGLLDLFMIYTPDQIRVTNTYHYFRKEGERMQPVEYENLRRALRENPASAALLNRSRRWRRVQRGLLAVGGALLGCGLYRGFYAMTIGEKRTVTTEINGTTFRYSKRDRWFRVHFALPLGAGLTLSSLFPLHKKKTLTRTAIETYNQP